MDKCAEAHISFCKQRNAAVVEMVLGEGRSELIVIQDVFGWLVFSALQALTISS